MYCGKPGFLSKLDFFIKVRFQLGGGLRCQCKAHTVGQHESLFDYIISTNVSVFTERFVKAGELLGELRTVTNQRPLSNHS